jgi:TonB-linked SusC/RagA family outer membrane protein
MVIMNKKLTVIFLLIMAAVPLRAQKMDISGVVTDSQGDPLPGVAVICGGSGVQTGIDGSYSIRVGEGEEYLEFSCLGLKPIRERIAGRIRIDITMEDDAIGLQEVVAIGYGSMKKEEITTSIVRVKSDEFVKGGVTSPLQLLQGKVAGLGMSNTSGDPGASPIISLRGISTLAASTAPLVVIDGVAGASLNSVAPEDIESMDVLKDGSAAAIYGTRGTNGVIIVTTRRPEKGTMTLEYDGYVKFDSMMGDRDRLSSAEWRDKMADEDIPASVRTTMQDYGSDSDWVGEITRNPVSHNHYLSARGGTAASNYVASVTYSDKQGIYNNSFDKTLAVKFSVVHSMFDNRLRASFNLHDKLGKYGFVPGELYDNASKWNPTFPMYDADGNYYMTNAQTPVCAANEWQGRNNYNMLSMNGRLEFRPIEDLKLSASAAYQDDFNEREWWGSHKTYSAVYGDEDGYAELSGGHGSDMTLELQADYSKIFGDNSLSATLGYSYNRYQNQNWSMKAYDMPVDGFGVWNIGIANSTLDGKSTLHSYKWARKLIGFYGRVNYSYANRYLFMVSLRREGSDKFGANNRWGWFPAVSTGWRISNEEFMKGLTWVNELKFRVGFGVTGTEPASAYQYISLYNFNTSYMSWSDGRWVNGIIPTNNPNPDLKWEEKQETNIGLDFSVLGNRIYGSLDTYMRKTKDLLYTYSVPTPPNITGSMLANVGSIMNKGVELQLNGDIIRGKGISLTLSGNVSYNANELISLSNDQYTLDYLKLGNLTHVQTYSHRVDPGQPIGNFYGWKQSGLKGQGTAWRIVGAENATAGEDQKTILGNGIPKIFSAFGASFRYKRIDASLSFHGAFLYQILNQYRMMYETLAWLQTYNVPRSAYEKIDGYYNTAPSTYCDYYIENGNYLRLDNVTIGYTFDTEKISFISKAKIYLSAKNLLTLTSYKGMDPEAVSITGLTPGIDNLTKYPTLRSITAGVNIVF